MANIPEIHLAPELIGQIGPFPITNATVAIWGTSLILIIIGILSRRKAGLIPTRPQMMMEMMMEFFMDKLESSFGTRKQAERFFPLIFTIFLFLFIANQFMLIPFVGSIVTEEGISLFRTPASDYSLPIALAVIVLLLANVLAIAIHPFRYIGNFVKIHLLFKVRSLKEIPMVFLEIFLGLLDIIGEVAKFVSISTRLFGNLFAGEVIIAIISGLMFYTQFFVPIPFLALSTLAGLVQAFVFAMLSMLYISQSIKSVQPSQ